VPFTVTTFQARHYALPSSLFDSKPTSMSGPAAHLICLSTCTLHVSHVSCAVAVSFFRAEGFAGSTEPTISHVTETVLQEFCVSPAIVPVTDGAVAPAARLAIVLGLTATALLAPVGFPLAGQPASVKFVSVTTQFASSAVPVFFTVIVTALLPLVCRSAPSLVTVSPGVSQPHAAVSFVPFNVKAFQPRHDAVPSSLLVTKPTSTNGPAPHFTCLSTFTLHVSHVSCADALSVFGCPGLFGSTEPTMSHVTETVLQESCVSPVIVPVAVTAGAPTPRSNMFGLPATEIS